VLALGQEPVLEPGKVQAVVQDLELALDQAQGMEQVLVPAPVPVLEPDKELAVGLEQEQALD
jgi:hypothetical protein